MNTGTSRFAQDIDVPKIEFYYHERFPKCNVSVIAGMPGKGKSTVSFDILRDHTVDKGKVGMFVGLDDDAGISRARAEAAGCDLSKLIIRDESDAIRLPKDLAQLELMILKHGISLIVFDPVNKVVTINPTRDEPMNEHVLGPLNAIIREHNVSVLFIDHANKHVSHRSDPMNALRGTALARSARSLAFFGVNPADENGRGMAWVKQSYGEKPPAMLYEIEGYDIYDDRDAEHLASVAKLILTDEDANGVDPVSLLTPVGADGGSGKRGPAAEALAAASEWLTEKLHDGAQHVKELRNDGAGDGHTWSTLRRALDSICGESVTVGGGNRSPRSRTYWQLPEKHPDRVSNPGYIDANDQYKEDRVEIAQEIIDRAKLVGDAKSKDAIADAEAWLDEIKAEANAPQSGVQVFEDDDKDKDDTPSITDDDIRKLLGGGE